MAQQRKTTAARTRRRSAPKKKPIRREVGGVVCLVLALCVGFSYFQDGGWLLDKLRWLCAGLLGYGYYAAAAALLLASYILLFHRGRSVTACLVSALLLPVLVGALIHLTSCAGDYPSPEGLLRDLWESGQAVTSGGALSGALAVLFEILVKKTLSILIFIILLVALLMLALRLTPSAVVTALRSRERTPYEEQPPEAVPAPKPARRSRPAIDIPLDGEEKLPAGRGPLLAKKPDTVRTPDELLSEKKEVAPAPAPAPAAESFSDTVKTVHEEEKVRHDEVEQQAKVVEQEIAAKEESTSPVYEYPPVTLLTEGKPANAQDAGAELRSNARRLAETLRSFGVDAKPGDVVRGPTVTRYEYTLDSGVKLSKVTNLQDDIALALGASGVRIAPIPDKISVVGIEVPNKLVSAVPIRSVIEAREFTAHRSNVAFAVGKDIAGNCIVGDITKLPHVLIAGTTGSGKSVCTNSLIVSLLYKSTPDEVRFIMVDPKMVELAPYNGIPHLLIPVVTDPKKAAGALQWAVYEMMKRYKLFSEHGVKDLSAYNKVAVTDEALKKLPTVVVVIDELADLMLVAAKEVEESICRVAQMGRAAGVHLVIATQRPSVDVITGLMKANIPSRIAFAVASAMESRIILDVAGAEKLVGRGDMLYSPLGEGKPKRVQGCFISSEEIERVVEFVKANGETNYDDSVIAQIDQNVAAGEKGGSRSAPAGNEQSEGDGDDELLPAAVEVVLETGQASVSMLQRRLKLGYARAARIVDEMETRGYVGPFEGSKPRQLLITKEQWQELKMKAEGTQSVSKSEE